ncbi:InlB B-repeat-containing protein [Algivirga pacifica]|uniref:Por secretion system C-terminal sorting domain-containing protein n=1 Tax=Algivirga pacifica TaxID=1162670 RepID=A0ABP9DD47_9BACT
MKLLKLTHVLGLLIGLLAIRTTNAQVPAPPSQWGEKDRWESLNPGGGGQIQDVYFDQNVEGRIWFSSDMEGVYRSDDFGQSWNFVSKDLSHGMAFVIAQEKGDPSTAKTYQGGLYGAHVSTNSNAPDYHDVTWDIIEETRGDAIASIGVSFDNQTVILAPGWQNKDPQKGQASLISPVQNLTTDKFNGARDLYISKDAGQTWSTVNYTTRTGYRNVFGVAMHPTTDNIYIGAAAGVFYSTNGGDSFVEVTKPTDALGDPGNATTIAKRPDGGARGVAVSPDGQYLYATYQTQGGATYAEKRWAIYAAKLNASGVPGSWQKIINNLPETAEWYDPKVDPRSTTSQHKILLGTVWNDNANRLGLWEGTVDLDASGNITAHNWTDVLNLPKAGRCYDFEPSWEVRDFIVRTFDYSPASWSKHQVISMGGMNVFLTDVDVPEYPCSSWKEVYGEVIYYHNGLAMSRERGFASPYSYDVDSYGSYMVQGNADHGLLQSLDHGYSWTSEHGPQGITNVMSVLTVPTNPALVLIDARKGYGAPSQSAGGLYAKVIDEQTIGDTPDWVLIGGDIPNTVGTTNGLPSRNYRAMSYDPNNVSRVYVSTRGKNWGGETIEGGVYVTDDVVATFNGTGSWRKISSSNMAYRDIRDVYADPNNSNYIYARSAGSGSAGSIYQGIRQTDGTYAWTDGEATLQNINDMYVFENGGQTWLVASGTINGQYGIHLNKNPRATNWSAASSWEYTGFDIAKSLELRPEKWIEPNEPIAIRGLAAYEQYIVAITEVTSHKKGLGCFLGEIKSDGTVSWRDWSMASGNNRMIENPTANQARVKIENGTPYFYIALAGTGPWRRQLATSCLEVSKAQHTFGNEVDNTIIPVTSDQSWTVSSTASWLTANRSGNYVSISVTENMGAQRVAEVTINGCETKIITVKQNSPASCIIELSSTTASFGAEGGATTVTATSDDSFSITTSASWVSAALSGDQLQVAAATNTTYKERTAVVTLTGCGEQQITVMQDAKANGNPVQGNETFTLLGNTSDWTTGAFTGDEGFVWNFTMAKKTSTINGNTIKLDNSEGGALEGTLSSGIESLSFWAAPTGTGNTSGVEVFVNNVSVGKFNIDKAAAPQQFTIDGINESAVADVKFVGFNNSDVQLDDISWVGYGESTASMYALLVTNGNGSGNYEAGEVVTIIANTPAEGEVFEGWTGDVTYLSDASALTTTLTMPAANVSVTANYSTAPQPTYTLNVVNGTGSGQYEVGTAISISANAPAAGEVFDKWTGAVNNLDDAFNPMATVTMPANGMTVTATYKAVETSSGGGLETFDNLPILNQWTDGSFVGNDNITWNYVQVKRTSTINGNTIKLDHSAGASLSATLPGGMSSLSFQAAPTGTGSPSGVEVFINGTSIFQYTIEKASAVQTITINNLEYEGDVALQLVGMNTSDVQLDDISWTGFEVVQPTYNLTVAGGTGSGVYEEGSVVTVVADAPAAGEEFDQWTGGVSNLNNKFDATTTLTMPAHGVTITATYKPISVTSDDGLETFDNLPTLNQWTDGSFTGNDNIVWSYVQAKRTSTINGNTIKLSNSVNGSLSADIPNGISSLSFKAAPTGTAQKSGVEVWINGVQQGTFEMEVNSGTNIFTLSNIDTEGTVNVSFKGFNNADPQLDDISWSSYTLTSGNRLDTNKTPFGLLNKEASKVYPTLVEDYLTIEVDRPQVVSMISVQGIVVKSLEVSQTTTIDLTALRKGMYVVKVGTEVFRMIKK